MSGLHWFTASNVLSTWAPCKEMLLRPFRLVDRKKWQLKSRKQTDAETTKTDADRLYSGCTCISQTCLHTHKIKNTHVNMCRCIKGGLHTYTQRCRHRKANTNYVRMHVHSQKRDRWMCAYISTLTQQGTDSDAQQAGRLTPRKSAQNADNIICNKWYWTTQEIKLNWNLN